MNKEQLLELAAQHLKLELNIIQDKFDILKHLNNIDQKDWTEEHLDILKRIYINKQ